MIFQIYYGICQSLDEGISETTNTKKILETSNGKGCNFVFPTQKRAQKAQPKMS